MQRVELLTGLEQQLGGEVPEAQLAEIYSVRDLVDAILDSAGRGEGHIGRTAPAWSTILSEPVEDPEVLALAGTIILRKYSFFAGEDHLSLCDGPVPLEGARAGKSSGERSVSAVLESSSYMDPLVMASVLPWRCFAPPSRSEPAKFSARDLCAGWRDGFGWWLSIRMQTWCRRCARGFMGWIRDAY